MKKKALSDNPEGIFTHVAQLASGSDSFENQDIVIVFKPPGRYGHERHLLLTPELDCESSLTPDHTSLDGLKLRAITLIGAGFESGM